MSIRTKSIRRLLLVAATAGAAAAIVGAAFTYRRHARDVELSAARIDGMKAYEAGDLAAALPHLTTYVAARPNDVDAIFALASAHVAIETPGRDNLFDARSRLQQVLAQKPDHLPAKRQLMKIYERTRLPRELLTVATDVLKAAPGDVDATRCRAVALTELERDEESLPAWAAYLALVPTDFRAQSQYLSTMKRTGHGPDELVAYAQRNVDEFPDDPRFLLPLAAAMREAGRDAEALAVLEGLAARPQQDAEFVVELAAALDRLRSFDVAEQLLARSADSLKSSSLSAALVERMWQNGRHQQVITATDGLLAGGRRDPNVLALRALSLSAMGRRDEAVKLNAEITAMKGNEEAAAWGTALTIELEPAKLSPVDQVRRLHEALDHDPDNGILYTWLGRALRRSGEPEQAIRCFREAAQRLPSWPTPCVELADVLLDAGRNADAAAAAKAAYLRAPSSMPVQLQVARVRFAQLMTKATPVETAELLARVEELSRRLPTEASLPAMRVALLASSGRQDDAETVAADAVVTLPRGASVQALYDASRRAGLKSANAVFQRAAADGVVTPSFAMSRAAELAAQPEGSATAIEWMKSQAALHRGNASWALSEVRVRQALGDADVESAWMQLLNAYPNDLTIQMTALSEAGEIVGDRAQQARIVERVKLIAGEDAAAYRIARARWLASSPDDGEARQALTLAADLVRAQPSRADLRVLLARVLVRLDSAATAVDHLRAAHSQSPADASIALELAETLRRSGRWTEGVTVLRDQAAYEIEDPQARAALAQGLVDAGAVEEALRILERAASRTTIAGNERLLLAGALDATGQAERAAAAYTAVAADPQATPAMLASVATFERRQGNLVRAQELLKRIEGASAPADDRARAVAGYAMEFGETDAARARYATELAAGKAGVALMIDAIALETSSGNLPAAAALVNRAVERFPGDPRVKRASLEVTARRSATEGTANADALDALMASMATDPSSRREVAALRALRQSQVAGKSTPELAARLAALADAYPSSIELSQQAITASIATGQRQIANAVARRLLASSGARVDAVALATRSLFQLGDYPAARRAAERWRAMAKSDPRAADTAIAQIALAENAPDRALAALDRHRATITWEGDGAMAATLAQALAKSGETEAAFELLEPALAQWPVARAAWLRAVDSVRGDAEARTAKLTQLEAMTPADATDEQLRLAGAYLDLAQSSGAPAAARRGVALLTPLEASGRLAGNGCALLAELQRVSGAPEKAQVTLREALVADPENAMAKNSLAYLLLSSPGGVDEACKLAAEAVAKAPGRASFHDTLARALLAARQSAKAEAAFKEAIRLDEGCLDAWVGLAGLQAQLGKLSEAQASMRRLDAAIARAAQKDVPVHLQAELRVVRESVASTRE